MNDCKTFLRHVYMDATFNEKELAEIYMYIIEYKADKSFRTEEHKFKVVEPAEPEEGELPEEVPDVRMEFLDQVAYLSKSSVPTEYYALDAEELMTELIEPMKEDIPKAKKIFNDISDKCTDAEWLHDHISMGKVIPMTDYDEMPEMGTELRRRMKERFHAVAGEIKKSHDSHIFVSYFKEETAPVFYVRIFDKNDITLGEYKLHGKITDDVMVAKVAEILKKYPEADVLCDRTSIRLYRFFRKAEKMEHLDNGHLFSVASMLHAVGKDDVCPAASAWKEYLEAASDLRFGRVEDDTVYGYHVFRLPVEVSGKVAWEKNFKKNSIWREASPFEYYLLGGEDKIPAPKKKKKQAAAPGEMMGKLVIEKDRESYALKLTRVSIRQYAGEFAVITLVAENRFYPGERDKKRINKLGASLWLRRDMTDELPDKVSVQIKTAEKTYSLTAMTRKEAGDEPWLSLLLTMGRKKKNTGADRFYATSLQDSMYVYAVDAPESEETEEAVGAALVRTEYLLALEKRLAEALEPLEGCTFSGLTGSQKREIKRISTEYACIVSSLTYKQERGEAKASYREAAAFTEMKAVESRLEKKLELLYE